MRATSQQFWSTARVSRARLTLILFGWLIATGACWDLVQMAAWTRMWFVQLEERSPAVAFVETFSPDALCRVCEYVQTAKRTTEESAPVAPKFPATLLWVPAEEALIIFPGEPLPPGLLQLIVRPGIGRAAPPVPPPRGA